MTPAATVCTLALAATAIGSTILINPTNVAAYLAIDAALIAYGAWCAYYVGTAFHRPTLPIEAVATLSALMWLKTSMPIGAYAAGILLLIAASYHHIRTSGDYRIRRAT